MQGIEQMFVSPFWRGDGVRKGDEVVSQHLRCPYHDPGHTRRPISLEYDIRTRKRYYSSVLNEGAHRVMFCVPPSRDTLRPFHTNVPVRSSGSRTVALIPSLPVRFRPTEIRPCG